MTDHELHHHRLLARVSQWSLTSGGILALLGILAIAAPWAASTVVVFLCGGTLIAAGVSQLAMTAATYTWRGFWLGLVCGALSVVAGTAMVAIPVEGAHVLVTFLGIVILFESVAKFAAAFALPGEFPRGWLFLDGVVTALLGGLLVASPRDMAGMYLGTLLGINLLSSGIAMLASGLWLKRRIAA